LSTYLSLAHSQISHHAAHTTFAALMLVASSVTVILILIEIDNYEVEEPTGRGN